MTDRPNDFVLTSFAPVVWGTTYLVTTEFLPAGYPITVAMLRALPAGLLLFCWVRTLPEARLWGKIAVLGALNISIFLICLFIAAYRLPGGVAATVAASQPLFAVFLGRVFLGTPLRVKAILLALLGITGVALLVLSPKFALDTIGVVAGLFGAASMATGNVLAKKWKPAATSVVAFTAWQLTAGGLLLVPVAFAIEPPLPSLSVHNVAALLWLSLIGGALTYLLWFRGVARLNPAAVSVLLFLSPATAVLLGWLFLGQELTLLQMIGVALVLGAVWATSTDAAKR
jgi:probable blue pigment (indigoidine) exporter